MTALVLSGSYQETNRFAAQKKLGYGIRHIVSKETLHGMRPTSIHILPSFRTRRDFHAVNAELKHVRRAVRNAPVIEYVRGDDGEYLTPAEAAYVEVPDSTPAPDPSPNAIPGQVALEEILDAIAEEVPSQADLEARKPAPKKRAPAKKAPAKKAEPADDLPDWMKS